MVENKGGERSGVVEDGLECALRGLSCVARKERKELTRRIERLLGELESGVECEGGAWVTAEWTSEQACAVAEAMQRVRSMDASSKVHEAEVSSAVTALVQAVEQVASSHVDRCEVLSDRKWRFLEREKAFALPKFERRFF